MEWAALNRMYQTAETGSRSAAEKLSCDIIEYRNSLINVAWRITNEKEAAEDIVQDAFLQIMGKTDQFHGDASPKTYIYRMVINKSIDYTRSVKRSRTVLERLFIERHRPCAPSDQTETRDLLQRLFKSVPDKFRVPLILAESEGMTYEEIADLLNVSLNTVRTRIFRCREKLRKELERLGLIS